MGPRRLWVLLLLLLWAVTLLLVPVGSRAEGVNQSCAGVKQPWANARFEQTLELYLNNYCGYCHSFSPADSRGMFGPNHDPAAGAAARYIGDPGYAGGATTALGYLSESIANPPVYLTPGYAATTHQMPAYEGLLTDAEITELAAFLLAYGDCPSAS